VHPRRDDEDMLRAACATTRRGHAPSSVRRALREAPVDGEDTAQRNARIERMRRALERAMLHRAHYGMHYEYEAPVDCARDETWRFAPIAVLSNVERDAFNVSHLRRFAI